MGEGGPQAADGIDAAGGRAAAGPGDLRRVASFLETALDRAAAARPHLGKLPLVHRLSRTEYQNAVRDLLALERAAARS